MTTQKIKDRERDSRHPDGPESPPDAVIDELAGLLPAEALEDALKCPEPEQITGPNASRVMASRFFGSSTWSMW
jgi:hypothetical protein